MNSFYNDNLADFLLNRSLITSIAYQNLDLASFKTGMFNTKYISQLKKYFENCEYQEFYALLFTSFFLCVETTKKIHDQSSELRQEIKMIISKGKIAEEGGTWIARGLYIFLIHFRCFYDFYVLHKLSGLGNISTYDSVYFKDEFGFILNIGEIYETKLALINTALRKIEKDEKIEFYNSILEDPSVFQNYITNNCNQTIFNFAKKIPPMSKKEEKINIFEWRKTLRECVELIDKAHEYKVKKDENGLPRQTDAVINKNEILFPNLLLVFKEALLNKYIQTEEKYENLKTEISHLDYKNTLYLIPYFISQGAFCNFSKDKHNKESFCYMIFIRSSLSFSNNRPNERANSLGLISNYMSALIMEMILRYTNEEALFNEYKKISFVADFFGFYLENSFGDKIAKNNEVFKNIAKTNFRFNNALPINTEKYPAFIYQRLTADYTKECLEKVGDYIKQDLAKLNEWLLQYANAGEQPSVIERQENLVERIYSALKPLYFPINFNYYDTQRAPAENLMRLDTRNFGANNKDDDTFFINCNAEILTKLTEIVLPILQNGSVLKN